MTYETLGDFIVPDGKSQDYQLFTDRQEIKILFYTDHPGVTLNDQDRRGVSYLKRLIESHQPAFAKVSVELKNRYTGSHVSFKLDDLLSKENYDEVWLFGIYQVNVKDFGVNQGGPENELDRGELCELDKWMKRGGVLITGDHSIFDPRSDAGNNNPETYLNLGRALGYQVPRARQLRKWEGPPSSFQNDSHNTQVQVGGISLEDDTLQTDDTPQKLDLVTYQPLGLPHPLFLGRRRKVIDVYPDHNHEGKVILPKTLNNEWPKTVGGWQPGPQIVARGSDNRPDKGRVTILAAYNGDPVAVGRIVADSTWHHYFNLNLWGFKDTGEGSVSDLLGQYYSNLAVWLSPLEKRQSMALAMFWWLATHPSVIEESRGDVLALGQAALAALLEVMTCCEIHELLQAIVQPDYQMLYSPTTGSNARYLPSQELVLGYIVLAYHQAFVALSSADNSTQLRTSTAEELIAAGSARAFQIYTEEMAATCGDSKAEETEENSKS